MYKHILVPTDGTERSVKAVEEAVALAAGLGAKVTFVSVLQPLHSIAVEPHIVGGMSPDTIAYVHQFLTADIEKRLGKARQVAEQAGVECQTVDIEKVDVAMGELDGKQVLAFLLVGDFSTCFSVVVSCFIFSFPSAAFVFGFYRNVLRYINGAARTSRK